MEDIERPLIRSSGIEKLGGFEKTRITEWYIVRDQASNFSTLNRLGFKHMTFIFANCTQDQRMLSFRHPFFGGAGGSGLALAMSIKGRIGISVRRKCFGFLISL
jgi:hypothetical protein